MEPGEMDNHDFGFEILAAVQGAFELREGVVIRVTIDFYFLNFNYVLCADSSHSSSSTKGERLSAKMRSLPSSSEPYETSSPKELGEKRQRNAA